MGISSPSKHIISPNDELILGQALTEGNTGNTTYTKFKEIKIGIKGVYRVKFDLKYAVAPPGYGRIYKNGIAFGTERSTSSGTYVTFTEDLIFDCLDLLQLYCKATSGGSVWWVNLKIYGDLGNAIVNLDT